MKRKTKPADGKGVGSIGMVRHYAWGALWRSRYVRGHLLHENLLPLLFKTRSDAKKYIEQRYGYIKTRRDLRSEPHCWRLPRPVRVTIMPNSK